MNKEILEKQIIEYRNELKLTADNRDKMSQMLNQQEIKIQQLLGAISAIERLLKEEEKPNVETEGHANHTEGKTFN
jgi:septal ring factor EnvC (AmiA/AmiB activator)